jgi:hypothetical protein
MKDEVKQLAVTTSFILHPFCDARRADLLYDGAVRRHSRPRTPHFKGAFVKIADELRRQYSVSYYPARPPLAGRRRQIKVRVDRDKVAVRSRQSYVFPQERMR